MGKKKKKTPGLLTARRLYFVILLGVLGTVVVMRERIFTSISYLIRGAETVEDSIEPPLDQKQSQDEVNKLDSLENKKSLSLEPITTDENELSDQDSDLATDDEVDTSENFTKITIFLVNPNSADDEFSLIMLSKEISQTSAILTQTIEELVNYDGKGWTSTDGTATSANEEDGTLSLLPVGSSLLTASISQGTATLNFNENFLYNSYGKTGFTAQIAQVVYTATRFSSVDAVQFLIEGKRYTLVSPDRIDISTPLTRKSLASFF